MHIHTHSYTDPVAMVSVCFLHVPITSVTCVACAERHCDPNSQQSFLRGDVHYALTKGTASVRGPVQHETGSDNLSGTRLHAAAASVSMKVSKRDFNICLNFHRITSIGAMGAMFMKHAEGVGNFQPISL